MKNNTQVLILAFFDILCFYGVLVGIIAVRYGSENFEYFMSLHLPPFSILFFFWFTIFAIFNLHEIGPHLHMLSIALIACFLVSGLFFYSFPSFSIAPKTNLVLFTIFFGLAATVTRIVFYYISIGIGKKRIIVLSGINNHTKEIITDTLHNPHSGYRVGALLIYGHETIPSFIPDTVPILRSIQELLAFTQHTQVHSIVYTALDNNDLYTAYYKLIPYGINFSHTANFLEELREIVPIYGTDYQWYIQNLPNLQSQVVHACKRFFDIVLSILFLPVLCVTFLVFAPFIWRGKNHPVFFRQVRFGKGEKTFTMIKFRTMKPNAEKHGPQGAQKNDPRIIRTGHFLRRTRLDELPQIINVLRGDMSFIGPRPERYETVAAFTKEIPHYHLRHMVRPGITGWAQVRHKYSTSNKDVAVKLMYDLYYIKNPSLVLETRIFFKTIAIVLIAKGQ